MGVMKIPGHDHQGPREVSLGEIRSVLGECALCRLAQTRTNIVFGSGNEHARVMIVGEAPGRNEDLSGAPFVGRSGKLLDEMLATAGMTRDDVYIANVVKCRPPNNRDPRTDEIEMCAPFLREQVRSVYPDVIVTLGNPATKFILKTDIGITKLRGKFHRFGQFTVMPTFHPAAALRNPAWMELLKSDFEMLGEWLGEAESQETGSE